VPTLHDDIVEVVALAQRGDPRRIERSVPVQVGFAPERRSTRDVLETRVPLEYVCRNYRACLPINYDRATASKAQLLFSGRSQK
jgi:hypothetical protein